MAFYNKSVQISAWYHLFFSYVSVFKLLLPNKIFLKEITIATMSLPESVNYVLHVVLQRLVGISSFNAT